MMDDQQQKHFYYVQLVQVGPIFFFFLSVAFFLLVRLSVTCTFVQVLKTVLSSALPLIKMIFFLNYPRK